jgi:hypothetical protein
MIKNLANNQLRGDNQGIEGNMDKCACSFITRRKNKIKTKTKNKPKNEKVTNQTKNKAKKEWKQR